MLAAAYMDRGVSAREASLAARRDFGGVEVTKQIYREHRGLNLLENLLQDLRLALRSLRKNPGFAAIAIGSLAIGIGCNSSMFAVVRALKFRTLPVPSPQELVQLRSFSPEFKSTVDTFSYPFVKELAKANLFRSAAAMFPIALSLYDGVRTSQVPAELITGDYFRTLGVKPALGRLLLPSDMTSLGANPVCVISYSLWQSRFAGQPNVLERSILMNGRRFQIVGVTEPGFQGSVLYWPHDVEVPVSMTAQFMQDVPWKSPNFTFLYVFGRLNPGQMRTAAEARLKVVAPRIGSKIRDPKNPDQTARFNQFSLLPASRGPGFMEDNTTQLSLLSGVVVLTLLIACANIACLLLARASAQERETAVQISLGAPRTRIIQRYLAESLLITAAGGVLGLIATRWLTHVFLYVLHLGYLEVQPDAGMLLFSLGACALTALLFGLFPGWQASRVNARVFGFREHGAARTSRSQNLFRKTLVAFQIALATVLLVGFALFLRSLQKVQSVNLGFDPDNVVIANLDPGKAGRSHAKSLEIYRAVLDRVRLLPDVESATLAFGIPFSGFIGQASFDAAKMTDAKVQSRLVPASSVAADYFRTLRIRILRGRDFNSEDLRKLHAVIVNRAFVDYYKLGDKAVGHHFNFDGDMEIVGVVANAKVQTVREEQSPAMFFPVTNDSSGQLSVMARTRGASDTVLREIRKIVQSVDSQTPMVDEQRLSELVSNQSFNERAITALCSIFSIFALLLSCMGLYGVVAYSISRRTQEIGVRFAIGASRPDVARLFLKESCALILSGLAVGIPAALALAWLVRTMLFGVEPADPSVITLAAAALTLACLTASALPLRRAFAIDPAEALRGE
ncbi:MAG: putative Permease [Bryobacterales bacterium]|nr:putative Permease [Bryobacterales bacterium]